jgi:hypothetical protein
VLKRAYARPLKDCWAEKGFKDHHGTHLEDQACALSGKTSVKGPVINFMKRKRQIQRA